MDDASKPVSQAGSKKPKTDAPAKPIRKKSKAELEREEKARKKEEQERENEASQQNPIILD